jgi:hypothetical protein
MMHMHKHDAGRLAREILDTCEPDARGAASVEPVAYKLLHRLVAQSRRVGVALEQYAAGPWHVAVAAPRGIARFVALPLLTVERGGFAIGVTDMREALEIVGFLNWCEVPEPEFG